MTKRVRKLIGACRKVVILEMNTYLGGPEQNKSFDNVPRTFIMLYYCRPNSKIYYKSVNLKKI